MHAPYVFLTKRMGPVKTQYSVLPVCEPTLSDIVGDHRYKQVNKSNPKQVSSTVHALVQNVIHMHALGVSHRHIRLDSILSVGDSSTIQLSDFRYARLFSQQATIGGFESPFERSPEAYLNPTDLASTAISEMKCDAFSLGMTLIMLFLGSGVRHSLNREQDFKQGYSPFVTLIKHQQNLENAIASLPIAYQDFVRSVTLMSTDDRCTVEQAYARYFPVEFTEFFSSLDLQQYVHVFDSKDQFQAVMETAYPGTCKIIRFSQDATKRLSFAFQTEAGPDYVELGDFHALSIHNKSVFDSLRTHFLDRLLRDPNSRIQFLDSLS